MSDEMKDKLAFHARKLFDEHGYHGTSLRDICDLAGCKMPTLYYHYQNKESLYDRVVGEAFCELVPRLWTQLPSGSDAKAYAAAMIIQKKNLSGEERIIYRLAIKTWLGFEDCGNCRQRLLEWEQAAYENNWKTYCGVVESKKWAEYISRSITAAILRILLMGEEISDDEIREEVSMIFDVATHSKRERMDDNGHLNS